MDTLTDFFVLCTGEVDQQIRAIVRHIEDRVRKTTGDRMLHREGMDSLNWVLLDYVDVVVHVFKPSFREFYRLEDLWGDAAVIRVRDSSAPDSAVRRRAAAKPAARRVSAARAKPRTAPAAAPKAKPRSAKPARKTPARKSPTRPKKQDAA